MSKDSRSSPWRRRELDQSIGRDSRSSPSRRQELDQSIGRDSRSSPSRRQELDQASGMDSRSLSSSIRQEFDQTRDMDSRSLPSRRREFDQTRGMDSRPSPSRRQEFDQTRGMDSRSSPSIRQEFDQARGIDSRSFSSRRQEFDQTSGRTLPPMPSNEQESQPSRSQTIVPPHLTRTTVRMQKPSKESSGEKEREEDESMVTMRHDSLDTTPLTIVSYNEENTGLLKLARVLIDQSRDDGFVKIAPLTPTSPSQPDEAPLFATLRLRSLHLDANFVNKNPPCFILCRETNDYNEDQQSLRGTIWTKNPDKDNLICVETPWLAMECALDDRFHRLQLILVPMLFACDDREARLKAALSGQLDGVRFEAGERVLVKKSKSVTGHPDTELTEAEIEHLSDGRVVIGDEDVSIDHVYALDYPHRQDLTWTRNLLDAPQTSLSFSKGDFVLYRDDNYGQWSVGKLFWMGSLAWSEMAMGIECVSWLEDTPKKIMRNFSFGEDEFMGPTTPSLPRYGSRKFDMGRYGRFNRQEMRELERTLSDEEFQPERIDERFINYIKVFDVEDEKKAKVIQKDGAEKIDSFYIFMQKGEDGDAEGTLWCKSSDHLSCFEFDDFDVPQVKVENVPDNRFQPIRSELVPLLLACEDREARLEAALSGQFEGIRFKKGEKVLVMRKQTARTGDPKQDLVEATITDLKDGQVHVNLGFTVTADKVFRENLLSESSEKPSWAKNLLPCPEKGFEKGCLIVGNESDEKLIVGCLHWRGCLPGQEDCLLGIECFTPHNDRKDHRFLRYVNVMGSVDATRVKMIKESTAHKVESFHICVAQKCSDEKICAGTLWGKCRDEMLSLDKLLDGMESDDGDIPGAPTLKVGIDRDACFKTVKPELVPFLLACDDPKLRLTALLSGQLDNVRFQKNEQVLVSSDHPTGDPDQDLILETIREVLDGKVVLHKEEPVTIDRIYAMDYHTRRPLKWAINLLDAKATSRPIASSKDELVAFQEEGYDQWSVGRLLWMGQLPWEEDPMLGIEILSSPPSRRHLMFKRKRFPEAYGHVFQEAFGHEEEFYLRDERCHHLLTRKDERFMNYVKLMDLEDKEKARIIEDGRVKKIDSFYIFMQKDADNKAQGTLWCKSSDQLSCFEFGDFDEPQVKVKNVPDNRFQPIRSELVPLLLACEDREVRLEAALSGQLEGIQFKKSERLVAVRKKTAPTGDPKQDLAETAITDLKDGQVFVGKGHAITLNNLFHKNYLNSKPSWSANLLPPEDNGKLVAFVEDDRCYLGRWKWLGEVPWLRHRMVGIEYVSEHPPKVDRSFLKYVSVVKTEGKNRLFIAPETTVNVSDKFLHLLKFDIGNLASCGTLWCRRGDEMFCWDDKVKVDRQMNDTRFADVDGKLIPFLLNCPRQARLVAALTGQLQQLRFEKGERVIVKKTSNPSGDPFYDLQSAVISNIENGRIFVDGVETMPDRIYSPLYLKSLPEWAQNQLGQPGFHHLPRGQKISFIESDDKRGEGYVGWFGQIPWFDDLTVGIELEEDHDIDQDFRFLEYIQILRCDAKKARIIPFRTVCDEFIGNAEISVFIEEASTDFPAGTHVSFIDKVKRVVLHGHVRWTGRHISMYSGTLAVVVMEKKHVNGSNGNFLGQRLVQCPQGRALLMATNEIVKVESFAVDDVVQDILNPEERGVVRKVIDSLKPNEKVEIQLDGQKSNKLTKHSFELKRRPRALPVVFSSPPLIGDEALSMCGRENGIQGASTNNFIDSLLFSMFAFTSSYENVFTMLSADSSASFSSVALQNLFNGVVYPLRTRKYVAAKDIDAYCNLLLHDTASPEQRSDVKPWLEHLFQGILPKEPHVQVGDDLTYESLGDVFNVEKQCLTSQLALEYSVMKSGQYFKEMPRTCILQFPWNDDENINILPMLTLDMKLCLEQSDFKRCKICGSKAQYICTNDFSEQGLQGTLLCNPCHAKTFRTGTQRISMPTIEPSHQVMSTKMDLSAVICYERSHYTCYVRCSNPKDGNWVFFDSVFEKANEQYVPKVEKVDADSLIRRAMTRNRGMVMRAELQEEKVHRSLLQHARCLIYELKR